LDRACCCRALRPSLRTMSPTRAPFATLGPLMRSRGQRPNDLSAHECGSALGAVFYLPRVLRPVRRERSNVPDRPEAVTVDRGLTTSQWAESGPFDLGRELISVLGADELPEPALPRKRPSATPAQHVVVGHQQQSEKRCANVAAPSVGFVQCSFGALNGFACPRRAGPFRTSLRNLNNCFDFHRHIEGERAHSDGTTRMPVTRRHELTPPRSIISMFYRADRRRDPMPDDSVRLD
jgi:hypothetical protein